MIEPYSMKRLPTKLRVFGHRISLAFLAGLALIPSCAVAQGSEKQIVEKAWYILETDRGLKTKTLTLKHNQKKFVMGERTKKERRVTVETMPLFAKPMAQRKISSGELEKDRVFSIREWISFEIFEEEGYYALIETVSGDTDPFGEDEDPAVRRTLFDKQGKMVFEVVGADVNTMPWHQIPGLFLILDTKLRKTEVVDRQKKVIVTFELLGGPWASPDRRYWFVRENKNNGELGKYSYILFDRKTGEKKVGIFKRPISRTRTMGKMDFNDKAELIFVVDGKKTVIPLNE